MAMNDDLDEELGRERPRPSSAAAGGKTLRFALVMFGACVVISLALGKLMPEFSPAPAPAPAKAGVTAAAVAPSQRGKPKTVGNALTYAADVSGHYYIDASVNGAQIRFLVDTGATLVALSPDDAAAAGISSDSLRFDQETRTANGVTHVARTSLRSIRLGQLEVNDVSAVVMEQPMPVSLLGMSFLSRVDGYSIRDGILTIEW